MDSLSKERRTRRSVELSTRQREALAFVVSFAGKHGYAPSLREIGEHMGIRSTNGVNDHLKALERKGYLARDQGRSRAIRLLSQATEATPAWLLERACTLADCWGPSVCATLEVATDESWWLLTLSAAGEPQNTALLAQLEPEFSSACWRLSSSQGCRVYAWGDPPALRGTARMIPDFCVRRRDVHAAANGPAHSLEARA